ncbi:hypothetical protein [Propionibacterium sp.]|uniref:sunset domain-containing protein n=1 Tax=Propionibacterium sp. TaxID=1977903 RepID=UPI0039EC6FC8
MSHKDKKQSVADAGDHAREAVADGAAAVEELVTAAVEYLSPKVKDAGEKVGPLVSDAYEKVGPGLANASEKVLPYYEKTKDRVAESVQTMKPKVQELLEKAGEVDYSEYKAKASQLADAASENAHTAAGKTTKVLQDALKSAGIDPSELSDQLAGQASAAKKQTTTAKKKCGLRGRRAKAEAKKAKKRAELIAAAKAAAAIKIAKETKKAQKRAKSHSRRNRLFTVIGIFTVLGIIVLAIRRLLMPRDDGWTPREPDQDFDDVTTDFSTHSDEDLTPPGSGSFTADDTSVPSRAAEGDADVPPVEPDSDTDGQATTEEAENVWTAEGGPARAADAAGADFGPDSYVGENPPEGYTIKGNKRSMKYHTPDAAGFARTHADVWFSSEEAAESAGFTKAMR